MAEKGPARHPIALRFARVRSVHQNEIAEDYVELIAELIEERGVARLVDLADRLGVSKPTVSNQIRRLQQQQFVRCQPYGSIFLTKRGIELAKESRERHRLVRDYLVALGVDEETADGDAEGIEHHVSEATARAFRKHLASLRRAARP